MSGRPGVSRLWLVDHLLKDGVGHHAGYNAALAASAERAEVPVVVVGHREFDGLNFSNARVFSHFGTDWRAEPPSWIARNRQLLNLLEKLSARRFRTNLQSLPSDIAAGDLVFAQMIAPRHLTAWLDWMKRLPTPPRLALHLGYQPWRFERKEVKSVLASMSKSMERKIRFVTDSEKLVAPFEAVLGHPVRHLPHVVETRFDPSPSVRDGAAPVFLVAGNARREKGFVDILEALDLLVGRLDAGDWSVRLQIHQPDSACAAALRGWRAPTGVTLVDECLGVESYNAALAEADVVLMPYHLDYYALRTSGVFCEARCAGKPLIATKGSWAGDRVEREGGGWVVPEKNPTALAASIALAAGPDWQSKVQQAAALQEPSSREFSPDHFISALIGLFGGNL